MATDSLSVASTQADEDEVTAAENTVDSTCVGQRTSEEHADEQGYNRHFKKNANTTSSGTSRSPAQGRNFSSRGSRVRQVELILQYQSRGGMFNSGRFAQTSPPYMGRMYGMATPMGVQMSVVPPFPGEYFEPQGSMFSPRFRFPPPSPLRNYNGRSGPESGGGVRRRAKSPTSVPSSCENSSPQQAREVGGDRGRERRVRECRENRDEQKSTPKESSEESLQMSPPTKTDSSRRDHQKFSAATPTNDPRSSAPLRSLRTESGRVTYPLIYVSPAGSISVILAHAIIIEMSIDRCVRVVCHDKFA
ncbi:hypothetical protein OSTOST_07958, partial [Ostertagia ostertagi]